MNVATPVILCVDDEPGNLKLLERTLGSSGYQVIKANDGREALDILGRLKVDMVLTDVLMPGIDGFEICRRIKGDERNRHIPVIMITALGSKADRIHGIEAGVDEFLAKPFDHDEVLARVKMLLRTKKLDEMLDDAYSNIQSLASFGSLIMTAFRPADFDFMEQIDRLADQIIRKYDDFAGKPSQVLVRIFNGNEFAWCRYVFESGRLERSGLDPGTPIRLAGSSSTQSITGFTAFKFHLPLAVIFCPASPLPLPPDHWGQWVSG